MMTTRRLIRFEYGSLIIVFAATLLAAEVRASDSGRAQDVTPAVAAGSDLASTAGENGTMSRSRFSTDPSTQIGTKEIEGIRLAAEDGLAQAQFTLGLCYESGHGVSKDSAQAIYWFRKAAEQGFDEAQYTLGCCYNGDDGFARDPGEAAKWWSKAAVQGYADAQFCLGLSYSIGEGVSKNPAEAAKWWRKAAGQDHPDAQYFLGISYATGLGVPKIHEQAVYWLRQAAAHGNENAMAELRKLGEDRALQVGK